MSADDNQEKLRERIICLFCEVIIPKQISKRLFPDDGAKPSETILNEAIEATKDKVKKIIDQIPVINIDTIHLRIPEPIFLENLLLTEYLYRNALSGENGTMKYLRRRREPDDYTLKQFLHAFGFYYPGDLKAYKETIHGYFLRNGFQLGDAEASFEMMISSLDKDKE